MARRGHRSREVRVVVPRRCRRDLASRRCDIEGERGRVREGGCGVRNHGPRAERAEELSAEGNARCLCLFGRVHPPCPLSDELTRVASPLVTRRRAINASHHTTSSRHKTTGPKSLSSRDYLSSQDDAYEKSPRHRALYSTLAARRGARRSPPPRLRCTLRPRPLATSLGLYLQW